MNQPRVRSHRHQCHRPRLAVRMAVALLLAAYTGAASASDAKVEYNRDIRPILSENCFACHGPDGAARKADLRLDLREAAVESGVLIPGDPENSELIFRIHEEDRSALMPPPKSDKVLTGEQKELLSRWIAQGAEYQPHWSFIAPKRPEPPAVKGETWVRNPIDRFVLAKLEAKGLTPAPEADRRTLIRRLSLDLTGLPPTPAEVEAFVADTSAGAYEEVVDRLLGSPRWGEHRGRYWLDAARYADTHGIHFDNMREMWSYRQNVIEAFNRNQPFDQFTIEQIAGDLLPDRTLDQHIASGFNRCNITTNEGGAIAEEYLVNYTRDRTETASQVWLGMTTGCAVCHDHKFDPLTQREFYELSAFFNNTTQVAMDGNIKDTPPVIFVPDRPDRPRWKELGTELAEARKGVEARKPIARAEFDKWLAAATPESVEKLIPTEGQRIRAVLGERGADAKAPQGGLAGSLELADAGDFEKNGAFSQGAWVRPDKPDLNGTIVARMDDKKGARGWDLRLEKGKVSLQIAHKAPEDMIRVVSNDAVKPGQWTHVFATYDGSAKAAGVKVYLNGQPVALGVLKDKLTGTIRAEVPLKVGQRNRGSKLEDTALHDLRIYGRAVPPGEVEQIVGAGRALYLVGLPAEKRPAPELDALLDWWQGTFDGPTKELKATIAAVGTEQATIKARGTVAHVAQERPEEPMAYILFRGEYDKRRDPVKAGTPAILPPMPSDLPRNRLGLARWLLLPEHPLTARVTVNRFWQEVFGTGLVRTAGDFGITGELPSHPELLDWLAVDFRETGWDVKRFYKRLVTSATYRQSAVTTPEKREKDAANRLLSRGPRFRMDAEMVRDYALTVSDLLAGKIGGPSVKPYQPDGVWEAVAMPGSTTRFYKQDSGDGLYRRSLYTFWKRAAPPASMEVFNAPSRETCTVQRERTNTPLQALVTLNDPQFIEAARHLAQNALKEGGASTGDRLDFMARKLLARPLRPEEGQIVESSLDDLLSNYRAHPKDAEALIAFGESKPDPELDAPTLAAWTMLANELMNLDEALNK